MRFGRSKNINILDVVALTVDLPSRQLKRGQVGTIVDVHSPGVFEIEFTDRAGRPYASLPLRASQFLVLFYDPQVSIPKNIIA